MTCDQVISLEKLLQFEVFLSERCTSHQSVESKKKKTTMRVLRAGYSDNIAFFVKKTSCKILSTKCNVLGKQRSLY